MPCPTTINLPPAEREIVKRWSQYNFTSMKAEILRSIRERAEREYEKQSRAAQQAAA